MSDDQFEMSSEEVASYIIDLKQEVKVNRKRLLTLIDSSFSLGTSQMAIRQISHRLVADCLDEEFTFTVNKQLEQFKQPLKIGTTPQDCYHHAHMISACLMAILSPSSSINANWADRENISPIIQCEVNDNELSRTEFQSLIYGHLASQIPEYKLDANKANKPTLLEIFNMIQEINGKVDKLCQALLPKEIKKEAGDKPNQQ